MPIYEYKAFTPGGEAKVGILDADSPREARLKLRKDNVHVVEIRPVGAKPKGLRERIRRRRAEFQGSSKRRLDEVATVTRQMATLLAAGIPLTETLKALIEQSENKKLEMVFRDVREKVTQGAGLAEALAFHPQYFNDLYVNMIRAGEASGNLDVVMARLADFTAGQRRLREKVSAALTYPIILLIIGALVVTILMTFVVPQITKMVSQTNKVLPLPTQVLIAASNFFADYWWLLCLGIAAVSWIFNRIYRTDRGRLAIDRLALRIPVFGSLFRKQGVARFAVTFSTLLKSGVPVVECLEISKTIVNNKVLEEVISEIRERIVEGTDIATPLKMSGAFPPLVGYMIAVGEQSGQLEQILDRIAAAYDEEIDVTTQKITALIEPVLIVLLASIVGFIVLAIIWPILELGNIQGV